MYVITYWVMPIAAVACALVALIILLRLALIPSMGPVRREGHWQYFALALMAAAILSGAVALVFQ